MPVNIGTGNAYVAVGYLPPCQHVDDDSIVPNFDVPTGLGRMEKAKDPAYGEQNKNRRPDY